MSVACLTSVRLRKREKDCFHVEEQKISISDATESTKCHLGQALTLDVTISDKLYLILSSINKKSSFTFFCFEKYKGLF